MRPNGERAIAVRPSRPTAYCARSAVRSCPRTLPRTREALPAKGRTRSGADQRQSAHDVERVGHDVAPGSSIGQSPKPSHINSTIFSPIVRASTSAVLYPAAGATLISIDGRRSPRDRARDHSSLGGNGDETAGWPCDQPQATARPGLPHSGLGRPGRRHLGTRHRARPPDRHLLDETPQDGTPRGASAGPAPREPRREGRSRHTASPRSEEHTSELQSLAYLVCRLLLEKKKNKKNKP